MENFIKKLLAFIAYLLLVIGVAVGMKTFGEDSSLGLGYIFGGLISSAIFGFMYVVVKFITFYYFVHKEEVTKFENEKTF